MKNKFRFILPRLLVLTVLLGIATLIIGTIFKLILFITVGIGVTSFVSAKIRKRKRSVTSEHGAISPYPMYAVYRQQQSAIVPVQHAFQENKKTIVPIY
ncbi:MAG: hypothetical protein ACTJHT_08020 [Sphingobacterium sp.]|uniref:hypothetical protein n=1 Tax=Sphingobacterium sp. JB170 TaxID=1434842 RepID=UPI00097EE8FB|nr:hypothetical protein [Sphingobacterium sp. JB170]SJN48860.1 hypothetical protein FM107_17795 [Sphingobacterium sp. JB170]